LITLRKAMLCTLSSFVVPGLFYVLS